MMFDYLKINNFETTTKPVVSISDDGTTLDLSENYLSKITLAEIKSIKKRIPSSVSSLNLSMPCLFLLLNHEVKITALKNIIPQHVTTLIFRRILLDHFSVEQIIALGNMIPRNITVLDLSKNYIYGINAEQALALKNMIPKNVTTLDLSENGLFVMFKNNATTLSNMIPTSVTTLRLKSNHLDSFTAQELRDFILAIPENVKIIDLRKNKLFSNKSKKEIDAFVQELGDVRHRLDLRDNLDLNNGNVHESDFSKAIIPMIQMHTSGVVNSTKTLPLEITTNIASHLSGLPGTCMQDVINPWTIKIAQRKFGAVDMIHDECDTQAINWMQFIGNMLSMPATQIASLALGLVILFSCSSVGMLALGAGLTFFAGISLAKSASSICCAEHENHAVSASL